MKKTIKKKKVTLLSKYRKLRLENIQLGRHIHQRDRELHIATDVLRITRRANSNLRSLILRLSVSADETRRACESQVKLIDEIKRSIVTAKEMVSE